MQQTLSRWPRTAFSILAVPTVWTNTYLSKGATFPGQHGEWKMTKHDEEFLLAKLRSAYQLIGYLVMESGSDGRRTSEGGDDGKQYVHCPGKPGSANSRS